MGIGGNSLTFQTKKRGNSKGLNWFKLAILTYRLKDNLADVQRKK